MDAILLSYESVITKETVLVFVNCDSIVLYCTKLAILFIRWFIEGGQLHNSFVLGTHLLADDNAN
jgi:hypothetical protein